MRNTLCVSEGAVVTAQHATHCDITERLRHPSRLLARSWYASNNDCVRDLVANQLWMPAEHNELNTSSGAECSFNTVKLVRGLNIEKGAARWSWHRVRGTHQRQTQQHDT